MAAMAETVSGLEGLEKGCQQAVKGQQVAQIWGSSGYSNASGLSVRG